MAVMIALTAVPLIGATQLHEFAPDEAKWSGPMQAGGSLQVRGGLGDIEVAASEGNEIVVEVKRGNEGSVVPRVLVVDTGKGIAVCADWTTKAGEASKCGSGGTLASSRAKGYARADLRVSVPSGTSVDAQTNSGNVRVAPLKASVSAKTYDGDVHVMADGPKANAENLTGTVTVDVTPETLSQKVKASTLKGKVHIGLPETRLVSYQIYGSGGPLFSAYPLEGGPQPRKKGETKQERMYRQITKNDYSGFLGPNGKVWLKLEIYATTTDAIVEIDTP